ncbi:winged helix DNA-binding domain-containing protein [Amycolatopsis sp. NBC_00345]|uniref:DNA glycosylase AlkZ-like family protein n=1 Tax=Amycolatopsis sp. NBC_00345 TaxID=2975955 RepID=UPI002E2773E7
MAARSRTPGVRRLSAMAMSASLATPVSLAEAVQAMGFVQYDPIRRPARAQDLILHQRVARYRAGDLDRAYAGLGLEENFFYTYGAMPPDVMSLLHPRAQRKNPGRRYRPAGLVADVHAVIRERGHTHPRDLVAHFGRVRAVNDWGGFSAATTRALEELHYYGLVRVAHRVNGTKVYEACSPPAQELTPAERLRALALRIARILAPVSVPSLRSALTQLQNTGGALPGRATVIGELLASGALETEVVDDVQYVWPADVVTTGVARRVRLLAPFDPIVWDRRRFEHLWGWPYRFEAYTPGAKRQFGYYALPMFWGDNAVGWVNLERGDGKLGVERHFAGRPLAGADFRRSFDLEVARMEAMLG